MIRIVLAICLIFELTVTYGQIKSPQDFFNHQYGKAYTPHHQLVAYIQHLAENSNRLQIEQIGTTTEGRPMMLCFISSPENLAKKENIRLTNLYHIGLHPSLPEQADEKVIIWLSYSVHGNEAAGSESAMQVIYDLIKPGNAKSNEWLSNALIIINPCLNPDGYNRYTQWNRTATSLVPNPSKDDIEHIEPWPYGRVNHYLFDLNRDWAWQSQHESRQFIAAYNKWMPQIHTDVHEMGYNEHYYFAPAAEPYHTFITNHQRNFQIEVGKNNAKYFDEKGWLYFTREVYDLFYPSYGDTYPTYNGAIGMTYEKAGIRASRAIEIESGDTLTLARRIEEHKTTSLATIEYSSGRGAELIREFRNFFRESRKQPKGKFHTYILKNHPRLERLSENLRRNGIQYTFAAEKKKAIGFHYSSANQKEFDIQKGDMVIYADQPKSILTQILFEYNTELPDSNTYDITAWSLPFAYNLDAYGLTTKLAIASQAARKEQNQIQWPSKAYAYYFNWNQMEAPRLLSKLYQQGYVVRMALKTITFEQTKVEKGSIFITRGDNPHKNLEKDLPDLLNNFEGAGYVESGMSSSGGDIGGNSFVILNKPKVLTLTGEGTANNESGQIWHYFDEVIGFPLTRTTVDQLSRVDLTNYNTLVLPDGGYELSENLMTKIKSWVNAGGKLITMGSSLSLFTDKEGWALNTYATDEEKENAKKEKELRILNARKDLYHDHERKELSDYVSGAIIENSLDESHPLTFGLIQPYYSLKTGNQAYKLLKNTWNPIYVPSSYKNLGFVGAKMKPQLAETVSYAVESMGRGNVVYMIDNPLFRGFWEGGNLLFSNAIFLIK